MQGNNKTLILAKDHMLILSSDANAIGYLKSIFCIFFLNIYVTLMWEIRFKLNAFKNIGEIQIIRGIIKKKQ